MSSSCSRLCLRGGRLETRRCRNGDKGAAANGEKRKAGDRAHGAGNPEGGAVVAEAGADGAGAEGGERRAKLVARGNPAVDHAGVLASEGLTGEPDRRRHRGDPVETIEDREPAEAV